MKLWISVQGNLALEEIVKMSGFHWKHCLCCVCIRTCYEMAFCILWASFFRIGKQIVNICKNRKKIKHFPVADRKNNSYFSLVFESLFIFKIQIRKRGYMECSIHKIVWPKTFQICSRHLWHDPECIRVEHTHRF